MNLTLDGKHILVTREQSQAKVFSKLLAKYGAIPIEVPLLHIKCLDIKATKQPIFERTFDWVFFTSAHGVECFIKQLTNKTFLKDCKIATVGHKTELALKKYGFQADFIPTTYNAEVMAKEFLKLYPQASNLLLVRGSISRKELIEAFSKHEISFDTLTVYETNFHEDMKHTLVQTLQERKLDFLTFTSPSTVEAFVQFVQNEVHVDDYVNIPTVCIGTTTEKSAVNAGFKYTFTPKSFTIESMVDKLEEIVHLEG